MFVSRQNNSGTELWQHGLSYQVLYRVKIPSSGPWLLLWRMDGGRGGEHDDPKTEAEYICTEQEGRTVDGNSHVISGGHLPRTEYGVRVLCIGTRTLTVCTKTVRSTLSYYICSSPSCSGPRVNGQLVLAYPIWPCRILHRHLKYSGNDSRWHALTSDHKQNHPQNEQNGINKEIRTAATKPAQNMAPWRYKYCHQWI